MSALFILGLAMWYRRAGARTRRHILVGVTAALLADEAALLLGMALTGQWNWSYLPLHLCSINVFVCLYNTVTDRSWCKEELYALCIPGAMLALLCPSWRDVPSWWTLINRLPAQRAPGAHGAGVSVRFGPAHLLFEQALADELLFSEQPLWQRHHQRVHRRTGREVLYPGLSARHCGSIGDHVSTVVCYRPEKAFMI